MRLLRFPLTAGVLCGVCTTLSACDQDKVLDLQHQLQSQAAAAADHQHMFEQQIQAEHDSIVELKQQLAAIHHEQQMSMFDDGEYQNIANSINSDAETLGRLLVSSTHPTGSYLQTGSPNVVLADDRRTVAVQLGVTWKGMLLEQPYTTTYRFQLGKKGLNRLEVVRDEALAQINPELLRQAEFRLTRYFAPAQ
jgi:hypothetical protein